MQIMKALFWNLPFFAILQSQFDNASQFDKIFVCGAVANMMQSLSIIPTPLLHIASKQYFMQMLQWSNTIADTFIVNLFEV